MTEFKEFGLSNNLLIKIEDLGITKPTSIQEKSIPLIIEGKDVIGESATGSGKTLAFGSGIVEKVEPQAGIQALVLTPTRELAQQVKESLKSFSYKRLKIITIFGGVSYTPQVADLSRADVVVATPGRLLDHLQRNNLDLSGIKILVLDEADRMFDMGFILDVEKIIRQCSKNRQTLFFSATMPPKVKRLADKYMKQPKSVSAVKYVDPKKLKQAYYQVPKNFKIALLLKLLNDQEAGLSMVFCNTRKNTDFVTQNLRLNKVRALAIHGGLSQNKRSGMIKMFNDANRGVLVCTDIAARGLHIDNVTHIFNYDLPFDATDYIHRIGRTARAGENGQVINLLSKYDYDNFSRILRDNPEFQVKKMEKPYLERIQIVEFISTRPSRPNYRPNGNYSYRGRR